MCLVNTKKMYLQCALPNDKWFIPITNKLFYTRKGIYLVLTEAELGQEKEAQRFAYCPNPSFAYYEGVQWMYVDQQGYCFIWRRNC